jgi:hypothetical protein
MYHDRTGWRCAFCVGKKYGSKGYPQIMLPISAAFFLCISFVCIFLPIWAAFLCGYPLFPYFLPTQNAQRHTVLSWYMYLGAPPSCNSCYVCTVMRILIVVRHNKTRQCCYLAVTVSRTSFKNVGRNVDL